jgi:hypothetical protein
MEWVFVLHFLHCMTYSETPPSTNGGLRGLSAEIGSLTDLSLQNLSLHSAASSLHSGQDLASGGEAAWMVNEQSVGVVAQLSRPHFGRTRTLNAANYCASVSSIWAGQQ